MNLSPAKITEASSTRHAGVFWTGVVIYLTSFFIPAVTPGEGTSALPGWECAWMTLRLHWISNWPGLLLFASGLLNPIVVCFSALWISGRHEKLRCRLAFATVTLIPASWVFLLITHCSIRIGHVAWVAGILMIAGGEILGAFERV